MRRIRVLFALATLFPIVVLGWLGVRILNQERIAERQRQRESLEIAAGRLALAIDRKFAAIEDQLARGNGLRFSPQGIDAPAGSALLFQPAAESSTSTKIQPVAISAVEQIEFQSQDPTAAEMAYRKLTRSADPEVRAAALIRLARVLRGRKKYDAALDVYRELQSMESASVIGEPAPLVARQGRVRVFEEKGSLGEMREAASDLAGVLYRGGWRIDRTTFDFYAELLRGWGAPPPPEKQMTQSEAVDRLWQSWRADELAPRGRKIIQTESGEAALAVWLSPTVWVTASPDFGQAVTALAEADGLSLAISDVDGHGISGSRIANGSSLSLTPGDTHLPFILTVAAQNIAAGVAERTRRFVLVGGLTLTILLMAAAAFALYRVTTRELMLARQQSDFVSAVSHEFRTPLTSMRHLTELLASGSITSDERKAQYYELLSRETERLHRMVEALLSFGRIEARAYAWRIEPVDAGELVQRVVADFREDSQTEGREIVCDNDASLPQLALDRDAFTRAIWNLLENAAKYSAPDRPIRVFVRRHDDQLWIGVQDEGAGIPPAERDKIFQKFVRGSDAKRAGIRGVGLGLALVQRIAEAHGGSVRLESEVGRGSRFILVIPCLES